MSEPAQHPTRPRALAFAAALLMNHSFLRAAVLAFGVVGLALFGTAVVASLVSPGWVEHTARELIRLQVEKKVHQQIESLDNNALMKRAEQATQEHREELAQAQRQLSAHLPEHVAKVIADMQDLDCECRKHIEDSIRKGYESQMGAATQAQARLNLLIRARYMETATQLTREFRIFTATHAAVFAFLMAAVLLRRKAGLHLLPVAGVLMGASGLTSYLYLFQQDWLHTLLFNDFAGWAYVGYMALVFAFLSDLVFNQGRVTAEVLSRVFEAVGSALSVAPC
ncbi:MAG TPA: hypothetical protein VFY35_11075 [Burkholderiaceae bacterium]|nr:hypothetical protein [Burkholderiaceae bacterium]